MVKYLGWVRCSYEEALSLKEMGVKGKMTCLVEMCEADEKTMQRLIAELPGFWPGSFTGVDESGKQLPRAEQKYWKLGSQDRCRKDEPASPLLPVEAEGVPWATALVEALKTLLSGEKGYNPPPPDAPLPKKPPPSPPPK